MKTFQEFLHLMDFIGNQTVQGLNESFSAASKGFKRQQMIHAQVSYLHRIHFVDKKINLKPNKCISAVKNIVVVTHF